MTVIIRSGSEHRTPLSKTTAHYFYKLLAAALWCSADMKLTHSLRPGNGMYGKSLSIPELSNSRGVNGGSPKVEGDRPPHPYCHPENFGSAKDAYSQPSAANFGSESRTRFSEREHKRGSISGIPFIIRNFLKKQSTLEIVL